MNKQAGSIPTPTPATAEDEKLLVELLDRYTAILNEALERAGSVLWIGATVAVAVLVPSLVSIAVVYRLNDSLENFLILVSTTLFTAFAIWYLVARLRARPSRRASDAAFALKRIVARASQVVDHSQGSYSQRFAMEIALASAESALARFEGLAPKRSAP